MLSDLHRRRAAGRAPPSARPAQLASLLRPAVTGAAALLACSLTPSDWAPLLNPAAMAVALLTLRGQGHRLRHPSRSVWPVDDKGMGRQTKGNKTNGTTLWEIQGIAPGKGSLT